jgi:hypothetical protein
MRRNAALSILLAILAGAAPAFAAPRTLDAFETSSGWRAVPADGVLMKLSTEPGPWGNCLRVDFDFQKGGGYAVLHRDLDLTLPENYRFAFRVRGNTAPQNLEFKLADSTGDNVWWINRRNFEFPASWETVTTKRRQISYAWGPLGGGELRHARALEFAITAGSGGKGTVWFDELSIEELPAPPQFPPRLRASASSGSPALAVDRVPVTAWTPEAADRAPWLILDLGYERDFGGLVLRWNGAGPPRSYDLELEGSGAWRTAARVRNARGARDYLPLPESEARRVRVAVREGRPSLSEVDVKPIEWGADPNSLYVAMARDAPRGSFPRAFLGEQNTWAIVGAFGGRTRVLMSEDGAVEVARGAFSIEPFLESGGRLVSWADAQIMQRLAGGRLPVPSVEWRAGDLALEVTAFADGEGAAAPLCVRYRVRNLSGRPVAAKLHLALRPLQVNPPSQFLNTTGGVGAIRSIERVAPGEWRINGGIAVRAVPAPDAAGAGALAGGDVVERLRGGAYPESAQSEDGGGRASGVMTWNLSLAAGAVTEIDVTAPIGEAPLSSNVLDATASAAAQERAEREWEGRLGGFALRIPDAEVQQSLEAQLGWMLMQRDSAALEPGSRAYARSWIRDGSLIGTALLRCGIQEPVRDYLRWFATHQFDNGKVPCCVDVRGSDPVPEHDSEGEFIFLTAECLRLAGDRALAEEMWPRVKGAVRYLNELRHQRLGPEWSAPANAPYRGILPPSISHEGYSAKPMHSYWDDLFALRGLKDAAWLARALRKPEANAYAALRDSFARDLKASVKAAIEAHAIDYVPGCADLGDFDATSTTIALDPVQAGDVLPPIALRQTFERYWSFFEQRRRGEIDWRDYTPYEMRSIGAMVRLGQRERAHALLRFFLTGRRPAAWRQWPEVVDREPRRLRFLGDLPHTWVGSDYVRSVLDMLAYEREADSSLVIAAGVPDAWLADSGVVLRGMRTRWGSLAYSARRDPAGEVVLRVESGGLRVPPGGLILRPPGVALADPAACLARAGAKGVRLAADPGGGVVVRTLPCELRWKNGCFEASRPGR